LRAGNLKILTSSIKQPIMLNEKLVTETLSSFTEPELIFLDFPKHLCTNENSNLLEIVDHFIVVAVRNLEGILKAKAVMNLLGKSANLVTFFPQKGSQTGYISLEKTREFLGIAPIVDLPYERGVEKILHLGLGLSFSRKSKYRSGMKTILETITKEESDNL
jgi:hypothetical protein